MNRYLIPLYTLLLTAAATTRMQAQDNEYRWVKYESMSFPDAMKQIKVRDGNNVVAPIYADTSKNNGLYAGFNGASGGLLAYWRQQTPNGRHTFMGGLLANRAGFPDQGINVINRSEYDGHFARNNGIVGGGYRGSFNNLTFNTVAGTTDILFPGKNTTASAGLTYRQPLGANASITGTTAITQIQRDGKTGNQVDAHVSSRFPLTLGGRKFTFNPMATYTYVLPGNQNEDMRTLGTVAVGAETQLPLNGNKSDGAKVNLFAVPHYSTDKTGGLRLGVTFNNIQTKKGWKFPGAFGLQLVMNSEDKPLNLLPNVIYTNVLGR